MTADRELRERLEAVQARLGRAKAALAAPPEVEAELAPLRDEQARLTAARQALTPRAEAGATELEVAEDALSQALRTQRGLLGRSLSVGMLRVLTGAGASAIGGLVGALALYLGLVLGLPAPLTTAGPIAGAALAAWTAWRLGRVS